MKPRAIDLNGGPLPSPTLVGIMVLLDRSGSMRSIRDPMRTGFADFVQEQRALGADGLWLSLDRFDSLGYDSPWERVPIDRVGALPLDARGDTPLADALMRFGRKAKAVIDDASDPTERLLLVVISDGQENASHAHTMAEARTFLESLQGPDCELLWFGNQESVAHAVATGLVGQSVTTAACMYAGEDAAFATQGLSWAASAYRHGQSASAALRSYVAPTSGTAR